MVPKLLRPMLNRVELLALTQGEVMIAESNFAEFMRRTVSGELDLIDFSR